MNEQNWRPSPDDVREDERPYTDPDTTPIPAFEEPGTTEDGNPEDIPPSDPEE